MSKAGSGEDAAPRSMRELVQKKFLEEVIDAAGKLLVIISLTSTLLLLLTLL